MNTNCGKFRTQLFTAALTLALLRVSAATAATLVPGDVYIIDEMLNGCIARVDGGSGARTLITCDRLLFDKYLKAPLGIATAPSGDLFVTVGAVIFKVNPVTGAVTKVANVEIVPQFPAFNIAVAPSGTVFVTGYEGRGIGYVLRIDPDSGSVVNLSPLSDPPLFKTVDIAIGATGDLFVVQTGLPGYAPAGVIRVNPNTGARVLVSSGGVLSRPVAIGADPRGDLFVLNQLDDDQGQIVRIDPATGAQRVVSSSGIRACMPVYHFTISVDATLMCGGIDVAPSGDLLVSNSDGRLVRVNPTTGAHTALSRSLISPANFMAVPVPPAFLAAPGVGGAEVRAFNLRTGMQLFGFAPYGATYTGGVRVAAGDVNGDGVPEVVTGTGGMVPAQVKVFDGRSVFAGQPKELYSLFPFTDTGVMGLFVTTSDVNGDGQPDILVAADEGGDPRVMAFNGATGLPFGRGAITSFLAYPTGFTGGVFISGYR